MAIKVFAHYIQIYFEASRELSLEDLEGPLRDTIAGDLPKVFIRNESIVVDISETGELK